MNEKIDFKSELEYAEANLSDDIQALAYIQEDLDIKSIEDLALSLPEIRNKMQILLKSMLYNKENILKTLEKGGNKNE